MCETKDFTPMTGFDNVQNVIARRYPETTRLRFQDVWNFFEDEELVAQAWAKEDDTWWVVVKPMEGDSL